MLHLFYFKEMHQGKHQEYEKKLHDVLIAQQQTDECKFANNDSKKKLLSSVPKKSKETWPSLTNSPTSKFISNPCKIIEKFLYVWKKFFCD